MSAIKPRNTDYTTLSSGSNKNETGETIGGAALKPLKSLKVENNSFQTLENPQKISETKEIAVESKSSDITLTSEKKVSENEVQTAVPQDYAREVKERKRQKLIAKDEKLLNSDNWLKRNGHTLTYAGVFLFTLFVYFRPYELIPGLSALSSMAWILAVATLVIYLPTQFSTEGNLTVLSTEVKCVLFMAAWAILTMPIAKNRALAWETFNDTFSKVVVIFIIMVNTLRTPARLKGLMWLSIGIGVMLSYQAIGLYRQGIFEAEGYRVQVDFGGMFGNPNDLALHMVIFIPIALMLGVGAKNKILKIIYFAAAAMMAAGNMVTQSRGGFLGLIAISAALVWKLGRKQRLKTILVSSVIGIIVMTLAPGNYGLRVLSIFIPGLDAAGSSDQRSELLKQSIFVTLRNPWGIGIGNFPEVGLRNLQTHNAFTQVSSELGVLAFLAFVILIVSPLRKLAAVERRMFEAEDFSWIYYMSIGLQASIIGFMVSGFFGPVAYNWFVYYPIAYAVCLRRIYQTERGEKVIETEKQDGLRNYFKLQKA
ncbi:MAG: O-antigen ligase family protein [Pyrinomonadaceae bacterium]